jgi:hypothetical protein
MKLKQNLIMLLMLNILNSYSSNLSNQNIAAHQIIKSKKDRLTEVKNKWAQDLSNQALKVLKFKLAAMDSLDLLKSDVQTVQKFLENQVKFLSYEILFNIFVNQSYKNLNDQKILNSILKIESVTLESLNKNFQKKFLNKEKIRQKIADYESANNFYQNLKVVKAQDISNLNWELARQLNQEITPLLRNQ